MAQKTPDEKKEAYFVLEDHYRKHEERPNFSRLGRELGWSASTLAKVWEDTTKRIREITGKQVGEALPKNNKRIIEKHPYIFESGRIYKRKRKEAIKNADEARLAKKRDNYHQRTNNESHEDYVKNKEIAQEQSRLIRNDKEKRRHEEVQIQNGTTKRCRGKGGLPYLHETPQPVFEDQNAKGKFQQPVLQPGELKPLKLLGSMDDFYPKQVAEIGLPKGFATKVLKEIYLKDRIAQTLATFLGPHRYSAQDRPKGRNMKFEESSAWSFKRAKQEAGSVETDQTFVYPKDRAALKAFLEKLCKAGLGDILKGIPGFLDLESRNMVVTEAFLFGVSYKRSDESNEDGPPVTHIDMDAGEGCHMGTLLIPLELPNCKIAPLVVKPEDEYYDYCYRSDAALFFKAGFHHATNIFGSCGGSRIMLSLHIGDYTPSDSLESLGRKSFKMKAAESVNKNPSMGKLKTWKENNQIEVDEDGTAKVKILKILNV